MYHHRKQYGVNLGSWFTLESWLTGSLFQGAKDPKGSEMDLLHGLGPEKAKQVLEGHWDNFINDGDWKVSAREMHVVMKLYQSSDVPPDTSV